MKLLSFCILSMMFSHAAADVAGSVTIEDSFARAAIQQQRNSAAFMTIHNSGVDAQLVKAKSPVAEIVELHTHINDNGIMRMRKIKQIELPSGQAVVLKPGGLHVMLLGLNRDLKTGERISVTLGFSDGSERLLSVPVRMVRMKHQKGSMGHKKTMNGQPAMMMH